MKIVIYEDNSVRNLFCQSTTLFFMDRGHVHDHRCGAEPVPEEITGGGTVRDVQPGRMEQVLLNGVAEGSEDIPPLVHLHPTALSVGTYLPASFSSNVRAGHVACDVRVQCIILENVSREQAASLTELSTVVVTESPLSVKKRRDGIAVDR